MSLYKMARIQYNNASKNALIILLKKKPVSFILWHKTIIVIGSDLINP